MNTTGPVMTVTDDLLAELELHYRSVNDDSRALLICELRRLRAENAELAKDAGRYRFLRDDAQWIEDVPTCITWKTNGDPQDILSDEELDESIDTAMAAQ